MKNLSFDFTNLYLAYVIQWSILDSSKKITIYLAFVQLVLTVQGLPLDFLSAVGSDPRPIYQTCCGTN
jgi:hypothetical protein